MARDQRPALAVSWLPQKGVGAGAGPARGDGHEEEEEEEEVPGWQSVCARPVCELTGLSFVCVPGQQAAEAGGGGVQPQTGQVHAGRWPAGWELR